MGLVYQGADVAGYERDILLTGQRTGILVTAAVQLFLALQPDGVWTVIIIPDPVLIPGAKPGKRIQRAGVIEIIEVEAAHPVPAVGTGVRVPGQHKA